MSLAYKCTMIFVELKNAKGMKKVPQCQVKENEELILQEDAGM